VTLASPYASRLSGAKPKQLVALWRANEAAATGLGFLPMEVLQAAFWQIDPARLSPSSPASQRPTRLPEARRFVTLEEWANGGEPAPPSRRAPAGRAAVRAGRRHAAPLPSCPMLHVTAAGDRIVPATRPRRESSLLAVGPCRHDRRAPVAQLDRALPSEGRGHRFESCRVRQLPPGSLGLLPPSIRHLRLPLTCAGPGPGARPQRHLLAISNVLTLVVRRAEHCWQLAGETR
jgi:hypothetical protein